MKKLGNGVCFIAIVGLVLSGVFGSLLVSQPVQAATSVNVVIIGGSTLSADGYTYTAANVMGCSYGGFLPVTGPAGELGDFTFTAMMPANVSAANLAPFDTAVLNMASSALCCNTGVLTAQQKADLLAFVASGKKLIIYDSECAPNPVDYSWMPYPFTTSNPGAMGARGVLTILEDTTLASYDPASPSYIDYAYLGTYTDAVGDMNVMVTYDSHWCVNMSGTNIAGTTGPVHCYAKYPAFTDKGLFIYNGLDQDEQWYNEQWLRKMWVLELKQPFNPSLLPCGVSPVGISLDPETASNQVSTAHTVVATLTDLQGHVQPNVPVTFTIESGPNAGASGTTVPASGMSDANGQISFTYTSNGHVGTDLIRACFRDQQEQLRCDEAQKEWITSPVNKDEFGYWIFDRGTLKPMRGCVPQSFCIDVALKGVLEEDGDKAVDPVTGCQKQEYDWTNSSFMWRTTDAYFVQMVTLEKIHGMRKGACNLIWANDYIRQQGKSLWSTPPSAINLCWPLLYETDGTKFVLSVVYQTNPAKPDPSGRSARVHKERYVWTVDWKAKDFSEFRARLNCFAANPAGTCELFVLPPAEVTKILGLLDGRGCTEFGTWDPGITLLMNSADPLDLQKAADKAVQLEALIDTDSCIDPCAAFGGLPIPTATGILNTNQVPIGSVLLTDFYYAANNAGLLMD